MTIRVYLMPRIGTGSSYKSDARRPKYQAQFGSARRAEIAYGPEPYYLVIADVSNPVHTTVMANSDVRALPSDLDSTIVEAQRAAITAALETANIPAQWVANGMTFRVFLRRLVGIFLLTQNVSGRGFRLLQASLDSQLSALPTNARQGLQDAAQSLQLDTAAITPTTLLRTALTGLGAQFAAIPVQAIGVSL